jgi:hypothetical protein
MADACSLRRLSMKNTRASDPTTRLTCSQNISKRSSGTCESQKPKKHTSYILSGSHANRSAWTYRTHGSFTRARHSSSIECGSHGVRVNVDDLRERDRDLALPVDQGLGADDRHADESPLGIEAQRVTLRRLVEVHSRRGIADVQVEHIDVRVIEDVVWTSG